MPLEVRVPLDPSPPNVPRNGAVAIYIQAHLLTVDVAVNETAIVSQTHIILPDGPLDPVVVRIAQIHIALRSAVSHRRVGRRHKGQEENPHQQSKPIHGGRHYFAFFTDATKSKLSPVFTRPAIPFRWVFSERFGQIHSFSHDFASFVLNFDVVAIKFLVIGIVFIGICGGNDRRLI